VGKGEKLEKVIEEEPEAPCLTCEEALICEKHPFKRKNVVKAISNQIKNHAYKKTLY